MELSVKDIMTENPIIFKVPGTLSEAVDALVRNNITGMPVADSNGIFAGVITRRDIFNNPNEIQAAMVMRKAKTVNPEDSIEFAAREMIRQRRRHITVTDDSNKVCGILTPQNFLGIISERFPNVGIKHLSLGITFPMWEKTPLSVAYYTMRYSGTFANPIIDMEGTFKGLITDRDLFDKIDITSNINRTNPGSDLDEDPWTWGGIRNMGSYFIERNQIKLPQETVESILIRDPVVAYSNEKIGSIAGKMSQGNFNHLPVLDGPGRLSGMLYDLDLMGVFDVKL